jgi:hypothetical protein
MNKILFTMVMMTALYGGSAFSQQCRTTRECQIENNALKNQVSKLQRENVRMYADLNQCLSTTGAANLNGREELMQRLNGLRFSALIGDLEYGNRNHNIDLQFIFFNEDLLARTSIPGVLAAQTTPVIIPDQFGEFITFTHPYSKRRSYFKDCSYTVLKDSRGEIIALEILQQPDGYSCPYKYNLKN